MAQAATFIDVTARATRSSENAGASFLNGMNNGSCQCGIGISSGPTALAGTPEQFTLKDQNGDARTPQVSQSIGGIGLNDGAITFQALDLVDMADDSGDGTVTVAGTGATLTTLAAGWVAGI